MGAEKKEERKAISEDKHGKGKAQRKDDLESKLKDLQRELESCLAERKKLEEYAKRLKATFENFKRESAEEKQRIIKNANEYLIGKLIPVLDDFERAFANAEADGAFVEGVRKIYKKLLKVLEDEGMSVIDPKGGKFDPFEHEAFERVETDEHEEYAVLEVVEKGYKFHGKVLKPAKVKVAIKPAAGEEEERGEK